jgi:ketosteroid isomerase-like protein
MIMSLNLPEPIAAYFADENRHDMDALARCFADDAVVRDEGRTIEGLPAIKEWRAETKKRYQHTVEPLASVARDGKIDVTVRVAGNFPGSPIDLQFVFTLEGGTISLLEIP